MARLLLKDRVDMTKHLPERARSSLLRRCDEAPILSATTERELLVRAKRGDRKATERLVLSHMRMVRKLARSYRRPGASEDDLFSEGMVGLLEAIRRFDLDRPNRFSTYAGWWVRAKIGRYVTESRHMVPLPSTRNARRIRRLMDRTVRRLAQELGRRPTREELAKALEVSAEEVAMVEGATRGRELSLGPTAEGSYREVKADLPSPEELAIDGDGRRRRCARISVALEILTEREREVVTRRILDEDSDSLASVGADLGISRERVRQIQQQAQRKLRQQLRDVA